MDAVDYKEKFEKLIQRIDDLIVNGWIDEKAGKAILKDFTLESEDERIRKELISLIKETHVTDRYYDLNKMLAWLEKRKEQKPTWSEEDERERERVVGLLEGWLSTFKETYYAKDCKRGIGWLKSLKDRVQPQPKQEWSEEDETLMNSSISYLCNLRDSFKSEYDKEAVQTCIYWIKSLLSRFNSAIQRRPTEEQKERKPVEQKPVWSEEDEIMLRKIIQYTISLSEGCEVDLNDQINWLKSIKERMQPQPKQELSEDAPTNEYVNLGLPSGTLWKSVNEEGYYTFDEAVEEFGDLLPTKEQWEELRGYCIWEWSNNGYVVTGPNNNTIFLPADGVETGVYDVGTDGHYWSCTNDKEGYAWDMYFDRDDLNVYLGFRYYGRSVRLVKDLSVYIKCLVN